MTVIGNSYPSNHHFVLVLSIYAGFFKMHPVALDNFYLLFFFGGEVGDIFKIKTIQNKGLDCKGEHKHKGLK